MSKIEICDFCGAQSPDGSGLHIANRWYDIKKRVPAVVHQVCVCCEDCWKCMTQAVHVLQGETNG